MPNKIWKMDSDKIIFLVIFPFNKMGGYYSKKSDEVDCVDDKWLLITRNVDSKPIFSQKDSDFDVLTLTGSMDDSCITIMSYHKLIWDLSEDCHTIMPYMFASAGWGDEGVTHLCLWPEPIDADAQFKKMENVEYFPRTSSVIKRMVEIDN